MRSRVFLPLLLAPLTVACTAILGDFSVGTGGGDGGDASNDVVTPDGNPGDVATDAPTKTLQCSEDNNARRQLNTTQLAWDQLAIANIPGQRLRVIATEGSNLHAYTRDSNNQITEIVSTYTNVYQVLEIQRLQDRFIALAWVKDSSATPGMEFGLFTLRDGDTAWTGPDLLTPQNPLPSDANRIQGTVFPVDPNTGVWFLVTFDVEASNSKQVLRAGYEKVAAPQPLVTIDTRTPYEYELRSSEIVGDPQHIFLMLGANGPGVSSALLYTLDAQSPAAVQPRVLQAQPSGASIFPMVFTNSPTQGKVDVGVIEADLNNLLATYRVGQVDITQMGTFDPSTLAGSAPPMTDAGVSSIPDLIIDKSVSHIEAFPSPQSENVISVSRTSNLNGPTSGVNFEWWDAITGGVRARQTGATNVLSDLTDIYRATMAFSAPPLGGLAQFAMVYSREPNSNQSNQPGDVWLTTISCSLQ